MAVMIRFECGSEDRTSKEYGPREHHTVTTEMRMPTWKWEKRQKLRLRTIRGMRVVRGEKGAA